VLRELSVLVVEDHDFQRDMMVAMLRKLNAKNVYTAGDGQQALDALSATPADIIISDVSMPGMDGLEFMRRLAQAGFRGSVILVSAIEAALLGASEAMTRAYGINLLGVIAKPVTRAALARLLVRHAPAAAKLNSKPVSIRTFGVDEILDGLKRNQFEPFFQPKVDMSTRRIVGMEALARWRHPRHGIVPPMSFITPLEEAGQIDQLTWPMLTKGMAFCSTLNATGVESSVAVNLALSSLGDADLAKRVTELASTYELAPERICIEVTETTATTNMATALENLTRLRLKGFTLSIDDFGTGYSSMQQLARIPFTELKVDRAFVTNALSNEAARVILKSSLQLARDLNIRAVAEGVETQRDWELLAELGCDLAQGYYIAQPMDARAYSAWLRDLSKNPHSVFMI
jgi:EAL domain-containing protein (putative c-di-GMP-specific phosphodiesterase class I)/CheY-like chemotaxis protein